MHMNVKPQWNYFREDFYFNALGEKDSSLGSFEGSNLDLSYLPRIQIRSAEDFSRLDLEACVFLIYWPIPSYVRTNHYIG